MNFIKRFYNQITNKQAVPYSFFINSGVMSSIITKTDALDFYKSWVYACVARRSMGLAQIEFKLYRLKDNDEVEELVEHELLELLYRVNPEMTKYNFIQLSVIYRDLLGASPWILSKTNENDKYPSNIFIARPEFFKVKKDDHGNLTGYLYEIGTYKKEFKKEEVLFLKNYNPKNPDRGIGVIEAVRQTAENDDYIMQSNKNLLKNNARPTGILEVDGNISSKQEKRLSKIFKAKYQGYENSYEVPLLQGGVKFKPMTLPPKDLDFIESRKMNRDEILSIFGVPKPVLGVFEDVNRASAIAAEYVFNKWTLEPLATEMIEQLNEFLVPMFGSNLWLSFEPLAKDDKEIELKRRSEGWNKWMTTNEVRELEGLEPMQGGDYIYLPLSSMPMIGDKKNIKVEGNYIKLKKKRENGVSLKMQKYIIKRIRNRELIRKRIAKKFTKSIISSIEKKDRVIKIVRNKKQVKTKNNDISLRIKKRMMGIWQEQMKRFFEYQEKRFLDAVNNTFKKEMSSQVGINRNNELSAVIEIIKPLYEITFDEGVMGASEILGEDFVLDKEFMREWLDRVSLEIGEKITDETIGKFNKTMQVGIAEGEDLEMLRIRVENVFEFARSYRAEMIARTESARGVTEGHRSAYEQYGVSSVEWLLSPDACDICKDKSTEDWDIKNIKGEIPVHPNCMCDFTPV